MSRLTFSDATRVFIQADWLALACELIIRVEVGAISCHIWRVLLPQIESRLSFDWNVVHDTAFFCQHQLPVFILVECNQSSHQLLMTQILRFQGVAYPHDSDR